MGELQAGRNVQWRSVKPYYEKWDHKAEGLTQGASALIAIAVTLATQGAGTQFLLPQLGLKVAAKSALGMAINAGVSTLASRATISLINNKGDLGKVFKELGSSQFVKSLATSMLTAGLTAGLPSDILPLQEAGLSANALPFVERLQNNLVNSLVSTSVETAIQGGSFGDNLVNSLRNVGVNQLLAVTDKYVGDITDGANKLPVANLIAHTIVGGLAAEATGGKFVTGAAAGLASAIAAQSGVFKGLSPTDIAKVSQLIGGAAALLAGGDGRDVNQGAATSQSAALNNYLTHAQLQELESKLAQCDDSSSKCKVALYKEYDQLSLANTRAMYACGTDNACILGHLRLIAEASAAADKLFGSEPLNTAYKHYLQARQDLDLTNGIVAYRYNLQLQGACPTMTSSCIAGYKALKATLTVGEVVIDGSPLIGDAKAFYEAYKSGKPLDYAMAILGIAGPAADALAKGSKLGRYDNLTLGEFTKLPEVAGLTAKQQELAYVEFVLKSSDNAALDALGSSIAARGTVRDANFAQNVIKSSEKFSDEGAQKYSDLAGYSIKTVDELANAINRGHIKVRDVPVDYVVTTGGTKLVLNTRTSVALDRAGVAKSDWYGSDKTGQLVNNETLPVGTTYDMLAEQQLIRNGLPPTGSPDIPR